MRDEIRLIKKLKKGSESALCELMRQYHSYVAYIVESITGKALSKEDKEEVTAGVFHALWRYRENIREEYGTVKPYLAVTARNMSRNALRAKPHVCCVELDACIHLHSDTDVERETLKKEICETLMECICELAEEDQVCLIGYYYYEKSLQTIAEETGLAVNTVKSRLFRARKKLKTKLEERGICYDGD